MRIQSVAWDDPAAVRLRAAMTAEVQGLYADDPTSQNRDAGLDIDPGSVVACFVAVADGPVGHIAVRELTGEMAGELEVKRMYVAPSHRGTDAADRLFVAAVDEARRRDARRLVLHTGDRQQAALRFYARHGCTPIPVFAPYERLAYSVCLELLLAPAPRDGS